MFRITLLGKNLYAHRCIEAEVFERIMEHIPGRSRAARITGKGAMVAGRTKIFFRCTGEIGVICRIFRCSGPKKFVNNLLQITSRLCFLTRSPCVSPEKRKSSAQNRTRTMNCPNSVSYGAWKFFSPYGSCSACTITKENREMLSDAAG